MCASEGIQDNVSNRRTPEGVRESIPIRGFTDARECENSPNCNPRPRREQIREIDLRRQKPSPLSHSPLQDDLNLRCGHEFRIDRGYSNRPLDVDVGHEAYSLTPGWTWRRTRHRCRPRSAHARALPARSRVGRWLKCPRGPRPLPPSPFRSRRASGTKTRSRRCLVLVDEASENGPGGTATVLGSAHGSSSPR